MRVGIKLNLCAGLKPERAATTHPVMAAELTKMLVQRGAHAVLGDSPGEPFSPVVLGRIYGAAGLRLCEEAGGELNRDFSHQTVEYPEAVTAKRFEYCSWLASCDAVISFCKLKSHGLMGMTAAVKNIYGVIPGTMKSEYHFRYPDPMAFAEISRPASGLEHYFSHMWEMMALERGEPYDLHGIQVGVGTLLTLRIYQKLLSVEERELLYLEAAKRRGLLPPDGEIPEAAAPFRIEDFKRSGATSSWFALDPGDRPVKRLLKKGLAVLLRSRPKLYDGCVGCGHCAKLCPAGAITIRGGKAVIDRKKCVRCFCCQEFCPSGAMRVQRTVIARLLE